MRNKNRHYNRTAITDEIRLLMSHKDESDIISEVLDRLNLSEIF